MGTNIIVDVVVIAVIIGSYLFGKYVTPKLSDDTKNMIENAVSELSFIATYADKFVRWAREFMKDKKGSEKMEEVIAKLQEIADKYDIHMTEDQIKAIAQTAYENMMGKGAADVQTIVEQAIEPLKVIAVATPATTPEGEQIAMLGDDTKVIKED